MYLILAMIMVMIFLLGKSANDSLKII